jgi:cytochrome c heme-lyase
LRCSLAKRCLLPSQGYALPFDRHDWVVDRCGRDVRYVIDFYSGMPMGPGSPVAMFLDVRPALDSFEALYDRVRMQLFWMFSGRWRDA